MLIKGAEYGLYVSDETTNYLHWNIECGFLKSTVDLLMKPNILAAFRDTASMCTERSKEESKMTSRSETVSARLRVFPSKV